jgi:hypothetical protein
MNADPRGMHPQPKLANLTFRLASDELGLEAEIRLRQLEGRWLAVANFRGDPEVGIGETPRTALTAALSTLGRRAATALMADPQLFGVSAAMRQPA